MEGFGHSHIKGNSEENPKNNKDLCFLCDPRGDPIAINFIRFCPKSHAIIKYKLDENQRCSLFFGFITIREKYGIHIPNEIYLIIRDILSEGWLELTPLQMNAPSIRHMLSCYNCAPTFMKMINNHSCNSHVLPRIYNK